MKQMTDFIPSRFFGILLASAVLFSCALGVPLSTLETGGVEGKGTVTLILYGCRYPDDLENLAILVREPPRHPFTLFVPETGYKVRNGVNEAEALKEAERFLRCSNRFDSAQVSAILGTDKTALGYEVRPLYTPLEFGRYDVLDVRYSLKDGAVTVYIRLDRDVEEKISPFESPAIGFGN